MANNKKTTSKSTTTTTTTVKKSSPDKGNGLGFVKISSNMPNQIAQEYTPEVFKESYNPETYRSDYQDRMDAALNNVLNFQYDPLQDASYQALAKVYGQRGNIAAKNSLGDAAALNGGYGTSFATAAAQQARNQYNQELAALIPDLEQAAYSRANNNLSVLGSADDRAYRNFRDAQADQLDRLNFELNKFNTNEGNRQWAFSQQYQQLRDAMADWEWAKGYNLDYDNHLYSTGQKTVKSKSSGSSSGGGGGRGGGGYYYGGGGNGGNNSTPSGSDPYPEAKKEAGRGTPQKGGGSSNIYGYVPTAGAGTAANMRLINSQDALRYTDSGEEQKKRYR